MPRVYDICKKCLRPMLPHESGLCGKCRFALLKVSRQQGELKEMFLPPSRKCHDCGKKTNDYRCPKCLARWRAKHGVSPNAVENGNFNSFRISGAQVNARNYD